LAPQILKREAAGEITEAELETQIETLEETVNTLESVFGKDDRVRITPTNRVPFNRIAHLRIKSSVGSGYFQGTGFLIGKRIIATAGHCVYLHDYGGWPMEIEVSVRRDGNSLPVPMAKATSFRTVQGWMFGKKRICDYGVIVMPPGWSMPQPTAFAYGVLNDPVIRGAKLNLAGYPADLSPAKTMWYHGRKGAKATTNVIYYRNDSFGGQSGSPVWITKNGKRTVVGFHTNGGSNSNSATRITSKVFANLEKWRQEGDGS
jgi:V8-like Glu-specific endopeptidase